MSQSLNDLAVAVLNDVEKMDWDVNNDSEHKYVIRKMKMAAQKSIETGLRTAAEISETCRVLRQELEDKK